MTVASQNLVVDASTGSAVPWAELPTVTLAEPMAAAVTTSIDAFPFVWAHAEQLQELMVLSAGRLTPDLRAQISDLGLTLRLPDGRVEASPVPRDPERGRLWLLTSGSTGRPKRVAHSLDSLTTVVGDQPPRRWLCPYSPGTYAWWQVVTLGLAGVGQDLVVVDPADIEGWTAAALEHRVTAASGTPTFWRQTLLRSRDELAKVPLEQVSLGGEPVDQAILDELAGIFPAARLSWLYASSEAGASIVVHDRRAGFPQEWLGRQRPGRPLLEVEGGELVITSPHHGAGLEGPIRTGDRVEIVDGRVRITGRIDRDEINVGGAKVSAGAVRDVLLAHPSVAWAAAKGRRAPLVGTVVTAEVVPVASADATALESDLVAWCRDRLPEHGVPRRLRFLDEIPAKETLKSDV